MSDFFGLGSPSSVVESDGDFFSFKIFLAKASASKFCESEPSLSSARGAFNVEFALGNLHFSELVFSVGQPIHRLLFHLLTS